VCRNKPLTAIRIVNIVPRRSGNIGLRSVRGELGDAQVSANDLVSASLRMRPDRIILGELLQSRSRLKRADTRHYAMQAIGLFVHLGRNEGKRSLEAVVLSSDLIATRPAVAGT